MTDQWIDRWASRPMWWLVVLALVVSVILGFWTQAVQAQSLPTQQLLFRQAQVSPAGANGLPDWMSAKVVDLPHDWSRSLPGFSGIVWYRLIFDADGAAASGQLFGLYLDRMCSAGEIYLNGRLVHRAGRVQEPVSRLCHQPQLVSVPAPLLLPRGNVVEIRLAGYSDRELTSRQRAGGLSAVELGPYALLAGGQSARMGFAVTVPLAVSVTLVLVGGFMFVMGCLNRVQSHLAYFGALMIGWALILARLWWTELPWRHAVTEGLLALLMGLVTWAAIQFLLRYAGLRHRWVDLVLPAQTVVMALTLWAAVPAHLATVSSIWFSILGIQTGLAAWAHLRATKAPRRQPMWLMGPLLAVVGLGLGTEYLAHVTALDSRVGQLGQLIPALLFMGLGLRMVQQYGQALESSERDRAELEVRIREATAQIERNFAQLAELRVEQVTERERKRIAGDLHDDLGAKLLTIVHTSDNERISTLAREALEEMRLSVRGLTGKAVRLENALGDWRAEVVSRLSQSGIEAEWTSPPDEEVTQTLSARAFVQTTRILREAVSNIIKHSGATRCTVRCTIADGDFQLLVQDNGNGIPMEMDGRLDRGHGMASMKHRAKQMQGQCLVESGPGYGTVIRLTLPLEQHVKSG
ncbi:MAG: ATP-binding protein [Aquabacterium sp.]